MKVDDIKNPVSNLTGVGESTAKCFANLNIFTVGDLLQFYPKDYRDRTRRIPIKNYASAEVHTIAKVTGHEWFGYGKTRTLKIHITDGTGEAELIAFNRAFLEKSYPVNSIIAVTGSFQVKYYKLQCSAFEIEKLSDQGELSDFENAPVPGSGIIPVYPLTEGLTQKKITKAIATAIKEYLHGIDDELSVDILSRRKLVSKQRCLHDIHQPSCLDDIHQARRALIYEELFKFQCSMARRAFEHKGAVPDSNISLPVDAATVTGSEADTNGENKKDFSPRQTALLERLPFTLSRDQMLVIQRINADIDRGYMERSRLMKIVEESEDCERTTNIRPPFTMQRLIQGDVGSGKTLVSIFACLRIIDWGGQCALMAPTEILAKQHAKTIADFLEPLGVRTAYLSGNLKASGRANLLNALKAGDINILVGTHALFSKSTVYKELSLAIIDEQHRFGVLQRQAIVEKGRAIVGGNTTHPVYAAPHLLMMSATPIPQTLALTAFGDLDISVIRTMPQGRKPVTTYLVVEGHEQNAYEAVRKELRNGHQAYFVYPAIDENLESDSASSLKSAEKEFQNLTQNVFPDFNCALIHSRIPEEQQSKILEQFHNGKIQVLAATTVVEVGVDVPDATCMVIEQADRFGLSQLHQLRGRVGRGSAQSYCFLIYRKNITETGISRMKILRENTDGFVIAEEDLKLRGPGELTGTVQAGNITLGIADLSRDQEILAEARTDAFEFMRRKLQDVPCGKDAAF